jgi:hypothetical protein
LQRSHLSGAVVFTALSHDFVLRRNLRAKKSDDAFSNSTFGSHHIRLVDSVAKRWNKLQTAEPKYLPQLPEIASGESFGAVHSEHATTFGGLLEIKAEPEDDDLENFANDYVDKVMQDLKVDPLLLFTLQRNDAPSLGDAAADLPLSASPYPVTSDSVVGTAAIPTQASKDPKNSPKRKPEIENNQLSSAVKKVRTVSIECVFGQHKLTASFVARHRKLLTRSSLRDFRAHWYQLQSAMQVPSPVLLYKICQHHSPFPSDSIVGQNSPGRPSSFQSLQGSTLYRLRSPPARSFSFL